MALDRDWTEWLSWLKTAAPLLVVYIVGVVLSLVFMRRWKRPCLLTLTAFLFKLTILFSYEFAARAMVRHGRMDLWETVALAVGIVDAFAYGLLIAAIFTARGAPAPKFPTWPLDSTPIDDAPFTQPKPPAASENTGIQERR
jgi:hypothetical protein